MEAPTKADSTEVQSNQNVPQPQREKKQPRGRGQPKSYYKDEVVQDTETSQKNDVATEKDKPTQEKSQQRQNQGQRTQGNRSEKTYLPKGSNSVSNGEANQGSSDDGKQNRPRIQRDKQGYNQDGGKKNSQKKKEPKEQKESKEPQERIGNERFDNSSLIENREISDPHRALQISEASRMQQVVPSGVSKEMQEKVKRIQEIVGDIEFHVVYGALEDLRFDEEKTVSFFLDKKPEIKKEVKQTRHQDPRGAPQTNQRWTSIVKKGMKTQYGFYDENAPLDEAQTEEEQQQQHPRQQQQQPQQQQQQNQQQQQQGTYSSQVMQSFMGVPVQLDPEALVSNLSMAIASQLQVIQEQTRMLTLMQNELANITQTGTSEKETLLHEKDMLKQKEMQLLEELDEVRERIQENARLLEENQKKKAERLSNITKNNFVANLLKKGPPPAAIGAQVPTEQVNARQPQQQQAPPAREQPRQENGGRQQQGKYQNRRNQDNRY